MRKMVDSLNCIIAYWLLQRIKISFVFPQKFTKKNFPWKAGQMRKWLYWLPLLFVKRRKKLKRKKTRWWDLNSNDRMFSCQTFNKLVFQSEYFEWNDYGIAFFCVRCPKNKCHPQTVLWLKSNGASIRSYNPHHTTPHR